MKDKLDETAEESVEEAAAKYLQAHIWETDYRNDADVIQAFEAGAKWAMKNAIDPDRYDVAYTAGYVDGKREGWNACVKAHGLEGAVGKLLGKGE